MFSNNVVCIINCILLCCERFMRLLGPWIIFGLWPDYGLNGMCMTRPEIDIVKGLQLLNIRELQRPYFTF